MKKRLISIICALCLTIPALSGCGCSSLSTLTFNSAFCEGGALPLPGYTETLIYNVDYVNSSEYFSKDSEIPDDQLTMKFTDGKYVSKLEVLGAKPSNVATDIEISADYSIYKLETELSVKVKYTTANGNFERTDKINSLCYFYSAALAPLYSKTTSSYTSVYNTNDGITLKVTDVESEISYNATEYTVKQNYGIHDFEQASKDGSAILENGNPTGKTYDYESRTVIDNAELFFALRNVVIAEESTSYLPVVSAVYGEYKTLAVNNSSQNEQSVTVKINGEQKTETIKVNNLYYSVSSKNESGASQKLVIQASGSTIPNLSLPVLYAEPLIIQNSSYKLGTLLYTLSEVEIKK